tara:strand:+ start:222 stop:413 length:192 start_codon:yes stop_codon:yes gene_type:complete
MASRKKVIYEGRKISKDRWGLFISKTEICYGASFGSSARQNVQRLVDRLNKIDDEVEETEEKK